MKLPPSLYKVDITAGFLGAVYGGDVIWRGCRELFHLYNKSGNFYFAFPPGQFENLLEFIKLVENKIGIKKTNFVLTDVSNVVYVEPCKFWTKQNIRFSLFTILLRAGMFHELGSKIEDTVPKYQYLLETKNAFAVFLKGKTWCNDTDGQWRDTFARYGSEKRLVKERPFWIRLKNKLFG